METWKLIAAVPPLMVFAGLWWYLASVDRRIRNVEEALSRSEREN